MLLWKQLKGGQELSERLTNEWQLIGFQGNDPATDFRGAGLLGLNQLVRICTYDRYKEETLSIFKDSIKEDNWYFFAVTGLNITKKLMESLKKS